MRYLLVIALAAIGCGRYYPGVATQQRVEDVAKGAVVERLGKNPAGLVCYHDRGAFHGPNRDLYTACLVIGTGRGRVYTILCNEHRCVKWRRWGVRYQ